MKWSEHSKIALLLFVAWLFIAAESGRADQQSKVTATTSHAMSITVLYDNYTLTEGLSTDWGFACVLKGTEKNILFDTGTNGSLLLQNMDKLQVRAEDVELVVISHEHSDHTGGLYSFLGRQNNVLVYLPTSASAGLVQGVESRGAQVQKPDNPLQICEGVHVAGLTIMGQVEQFLVLDTAKGLVVITGCAHPGIVQIVQKAKQMLNKDIYFVFGGFHLLDQSDSQIQDIIRQFRELGVQKVGASHCTGNRAIQLFKEAYGKDFVPIGVGRISIRNVCDFTNDGVINFRDFAVCASSWRTAAGEPGWKPQADIGPPLFADSIVDFQDLPGFVEHWLLEIGLVAHWRLDEKQGNIARDSVGSYDGTVTGEPSWLPATGRVGGALQLDGIDDYVSTPFVLNPADGAFSAFVWIKAGAEGQAIISQASGMGTGRSWLTADMEDGRLMTELRASGRQGSPLLSELVISDGDWHHVGLVWDGSRRYLYADGTERASDNKPQSGLESADGGLYFGAGNSLDPNTFWSGLIDDVRIYDQALSAEAVSQLTNLLVSQGQRDATVERAIEIQEAYTDFLLSLEGVAGVAVGYDEHYRVVIKVFVTQPDVAGIPEELDGVPVQMVVTDEFYAVRESRAVLIAGAGDPVDRTGRFPRPVPIGVSTGHIGVTAGTIACRLKDEAGNVYALSNNHIYARTNTATIGDNVLQPGPYDGGQNPEDAIGTLYDFEPINFSLLASNTIDAAIARCTLETLDNATPPDGYGKPRSKTAVARLHQKVQKYGRTTGLTEGKIDAINAIVIVLYRNPDFDPDTGTGGLPFRIARFDNQILAKPGGDFAQPGDSGSLVITPAKKAVGLLFAGSSTYTICNPIDLVLQRFAVTIDDQ